MQKYEFTIYKKIPSLNETKRWHWTKTRRERNSWRNEFLIEMPGSATAIEKARITVTSYRSKLLDDDNFRGGMKEMIDGLRDTRIIKNDDKKCLEHGDHQQVIDSKNPRTEIILEVLE